METFHGNCSQCGGEVVTYSIYAGHQTPTCKRCGAKAKGFTIETEGGKSQDFREFPRESQQEYFGLVPRKK